MSSLLPLLIAMYCFISLENVHIFIERVLCAKAKRTKVKTTVLALEASGLGQYFPQQIVSP